VGQGAVKAAVIRDRAGPRQSTHRALVFKAGQAKAIYAPFASARELGATALAKTTTTAHVQLEYCVDPRGRVSQVLLIESSGDVEVDRLWLNAVATWRIEPLFEAGRAITTCTLRRFDFELSPVSPGAQ
jgi:TonB family protein